MARLRFQAWRYRRFPRLSLWLLKRRALKGYAFTDHTLSFEQIERICAEHPWRV